MTPSDITNGDWRLLSHDPQTGVTNWWLDLGNGTAVIRTDTPVDELLDDNAEAYNNSIGQRFGNGQVVASIPLNIYHEQLAEAQREGDRKFVKRWLNDADNQKFRRFRGNV